MADRAMDIHKISADAALKFDHFVLGMLVAVCAYLAQSTEFGVLGWNAYTLQLLSMLFLATSAFCGFKRIEWLNTAHRINGVYLDRKTELRESEQQTQSQVEKELKAITDEMKSIRKKTKYYYRVRNWMMMIGFTSYLAAKVINPYMDPTYKGEGLGPTTEQTLIQSHLAPRGTFGI